MTAPLDAPGAGVDRVAKFGELQGSGLANAGRCARDQRSLVGVVGHGLDHMALGREAWITVAL